ncbi:uncharacterized protein [Trachinotus anak]|uniref:uncharacterized protein n=1 Tax=Trachinotus anak TaxID=443729 RepID=UPI0039F1A8F5
MQALVLPLQKLLSQVKDNANAIVLSVLVFSYHVFENEFPCSCQPQSDYCRVYMVVPCLIITILMLSTDLPFQRAWSYTTSKGLCHFGCVLFRRSVKAVCVGLLWASSVLIDAEWYVCCCNHNPRVLADLQCKAKTEITPAGKPVVTIAEMKTNSRLYGISLLFGITFVGAVLLSTWTICADFCFLQCCRREVLVHELLLEAGEDVVLQTMKERQKSILSKTVNDYINQGAWEKCLDVVEDLINPVEEQQRCLNMCNTQDPVSSTSTSTVVTEGQHKDNGGNRNQD